MAMPLLHLGLLVRDQERSLRFYATWFGFDAAGARTYQRLRDGYRFQRRGLVAVKGKGEMVTWFLVGGTQ